MVNVEDTGSGSAGSAGMRSAPVQPHYGRRRFAAALIVAGLIAIPVTVGYQLGHGVGSSSASLSSQLLPAPLGSSQGSSSAASGGSRDASAISDQIGASIVNINTTLSSGGQAAGTGIIVSSGGLVLTNNHVIADSTSLQVEIAGNGSEHAAKVLGYDVADDVALIQIENVSGLTAAPAGAASSLSVGDAVVALGNAGGQGGSPSVASGSVTALNQQITASDQDGSNPETLQHLVEIDANIQPGDSGGPLVNAGGQVVGMDAAASAGNGGFGFSGQSANQGYAIPIENALAIAEKIATGDGGADIHVGGTRALLGVAIQPDSSANNDPYGTNPGSTDGAVVAGVQSGSGAAQTSIAQGDVITGLDAKQIDSASALAQAMAGYAPGDTVQITWADSSGSTHHASAHLGSGPPA